MPSGPSLTSRISSSRIVPDLVMPGPTMPYQPGPAAPSPSHQAKPHPALPHRPSHTPPRPTSRSAPGGPNLDSTLGPSHAGPATPMEPGLALRARPPVRAATSRVPPATRCHTIRTEPLAPSVRSGTSRARPHPPRLACQDLPSQVPPNLVAPNPDLCRLPGPVAPYPNPSRRPRSHRVSPAVPSWPLTIPGLVRVPRSPPRPPRYRRTRSDCRCG